MPVPSAARKVSSVPGVPLSSVAVPVPELQTQVIYGPRVKAAAWKGLCWEAGCGLKKKSHRLLGRIFGRSNSRLPVAFQ